jgi:hypothetical protein
LQNTGGFALYLGLARAKSACYWLQAVQHCSAGGPPSACKQYWVGLAISDKKIIPRKTESAKQLVFSGGILTVLRNRKLSEFRSEPLRRGEKCLEFCTVEQK